MLLLPLPVLKGDRCRETAAGAVGDEDTEGGEGTRKPRAPGTATAPSTTKSTRPKRCRWCLDDERPVDGAGAAAAVVAAPPIIRRRRDDTILRSAGWSGYFRCSCPRPLDDVLGPRTCERCKAVVWLEIDSIQCDPIDRSPGNFLHKQKGKERLWIEWGYVLVPFEHGANDGLGTPARSIYVHAFLRDFLFFSFVILSFCLPQACTTTMMCVAFFG